MTIPITDPLMHQTSADTFWTTVNAAEARPGVSTPLSQSFWGNAAELAARRAFCDMGVIPPSMVKVGSADENISGVFYGRCAANVDVLRDIAERTPGMDGNSLELQFLGSVRDTVPARPASKSRTHVVAAKAPLVVATTARKIRGAEHEFHDWWWGRTRVPLAHPGGLNEARERFRTAMWLQLRVTYTAQGMFTSLSEVAAAAGLPGLERQLVTGYGTLHENRLVDDMAAVTAGRMPIETFTERWGYHGPREGELMSMSWRESTTALLRAIANTPDRPPTADRAQQRERAEAQLVAAVPRRKRPGVRALLSLVRTYVPLRELGKALYVQAIDAARASARATGQAWHLDGHLDDPDDVFFLTIPEIGHGPTSATRETVALRRARHVEYQRLDLPLSWTGMPEPIELDTAPTTLPASFTGIAVSSGEAVVGSARVILDPTTDDPVEPGEILVCETTDPSWVASFVSSSALVIDIGGAMSHGAIVARELGIPAVINTRNASRTIKTGDTLRVDGAAGTVEVTRRAPLPTPQGETR